MADSGSSTARGMGAARKGGKYSVFKKGGMAKHADAAMDKKLIRSEFKKMEKKEDGYAKGGSVARGMGCATKGGNYKIT